MVPSAANETLFAIGASGELGRRAVEEVFARDTVERHSSRKPESFAAFLVENRAALGL